MLPRLASALLILFMVYAGSRAMVRFLPGDPIDTLMAESGTSLPREKIRHDLNLDEPFLPALGHDFKKALHGDLGSSLLSRQPVGPIVAWRFFKSLELTLTALALGMSISLLIGLTAAANPPGWLGASANFICSFYGALAAALPTPWIGPVLAYLLGVWLPIFPLGNHLALPSLTLAAGFSGIWARLIRERVRESLAHGAAQGARARGVPEQKVILKYGLMPASGSLLGYLGTQFGVLLAGAFVTEIIFDWNGMGSLMVESVLRRDYPLVEASVFIASASCLFGTWLGDLAQARWSPKGIG